jgi:hypothetical protein
VLASAGGQGASGPGAGGGIGGGGEVDRTRELEALPTQELERLVADDDAFTAFLVKWMQNSPVSGIVLSRLSLRTWSSGVRCAFDAADHVLHPFPIIDAGCSRTGRDSATGKRNVECSRSTEVAGRELLRLFTKRWPCSTQLL